jgi:WD40 repeat protein
VLRIQVGSAAVRRLWFTPDGGALVARATGDRYVRCPADQPGVTEPVGRTDAQTLLAVSRDMSLTVGLSPDDSLDDAWELTLRGRDGREFRLAALSPYGAAAVLAFSPDGQRLWGRVSPMRAKGGAVVLRCWCTNTGKELIETTAEAVGEDLVPSPDHRYLFTSPFTLGPPFRPLLFDVVAREWKPMASLPGRPLSAAWSPNGRILAVGTPSGLAIYDVQSRRRVQVVDGHGGSVPAVAFHPNGQSLFTGGENRTIRRWSVGARLASGPAYKWGGGSVWSLAISPDGQLGAAGGASGEVGVWELG